MKQLTIVLLTLLMSMGILGERVSLKCKGGFQQLEVGTSLGTGFTNQGDTVNTSGTSIYKSAINPAVLLFTFNEKKKTASIKLPAEMQPYSMKSRFIKKYIDLHDVLITDNEIKGKVSFPKKLIQSKITVDRVTGVMNYKRSDFTFSGECSIFDDSIKKF